MYLFSEGPREYDFLLKILSMGRDNYWRNAIVEKARLPPEGGRVLDIACGTGLVSFDFASRGNTVVGVDVTREMLLRANDLLKKMGKDLDVDLIQARAENLPLRSDQFDCVTDQPRHPKCIQCSGNLPGDGAMCEGGRPGDLYGFYETARKHLCPFLQFLHLHSLARSRSGNFEALVRYLLLSRRIDSAI